MRGTHREEVHRRSPPWRPRRAAAARSFLRRARGEHPPLGIDAETKPVLPVYPDARKPVEREKRAWLEGAYGLVDWLVFFLSVIGAREAGVWLKGAYSRRFEDDWKHESCRFEVGPGRACWRRARPTSRLPRLRVGVHRGCPSFRLGDGTVSVQRPGATFNQRGRRRTGRGRYYSKIRVVVVQYVWRRFQPAGKHPSFPAT